MPTTRRASKRLKRTTEQEEQKDAEPAREEAGPSGAPPMSPHEAAPATTSAPAIAPASDLQLSMQVKWTSVGMTEEKTRIIRLSLKQLEDVDKLGGLSKGLMDRAFPADSRPEYLTDDMYHRWTPDETCLSYPLDVTKTEFKLVASYNGWEYVILSHELGSPGEAQERKLFVTVIEFESVAVVLGNLGIRISLVAYPVICVQKSFLELVRNQLENNPHFKGILT